MKYIVDSLPKTQKDCEYSEWEPYPPFIEKWVDISVKKMVRIVI